MKRRKAREHVLQILYQLETMHGSDNFSTLPQRDIAEDFLKHFPLNRANVDEAYLVRLLKSVLQNTPEIDSAIEKSSDHWKISRMARIDRNILRIATAELLFAKETDASVVFDEAIEIAKKYGTEESPPFINGILDMVSKKLTAAEGAR